MKTIYLVFDKITKHVLGAYPDIETLQFEIIVNTCKNVYSPNNIYIKQEDEVDDMVYDRLIRTYKRTEIWN